MTVLLLLVQRNFFKLIHEMANNILKLNKIDWGHLIEIIIGMEMFIENN